MDTSIVANRDINQKSVTENIDPDEMAHYELSYLDLHCLHKCFELVCWAERVNFLPYLF